MAKTLFLSDVHGDKRNLEIAVKTAMKEGANSSLGLGDWTFKTMSTVTNQEANVAQMAAQKFMQDTPEREAALEGHYSEKQLEMLADRLKNAKNVSRKVADAELFDMKNALEKAGKVTALGGNHDLEQSINDVFKDNFKQASVEDINNAKTACLSGGGASPGTAIASEILSSKHPKGWDSLVMKEDFDADILASHVPATLGENVERAGDEATEYIKQMLSQRRIKGMENPEVYIWGHVHGTADVKWNDELKGFQVTPGALGREHNTNTAPTFQIGNFDDDGKLRKVFDYEVRSSAKGAALVVKTKEHVLDYEDKSVDTKDVFETVISQDDKKEFTNNLKLDSNFRIMEKGFSTNYENMSIEEKDAQLKRNMAIMQEEIEENKEFFMETVRGALCENADSRGNLSKDAVKKAKQDIKDMLAEKAMEGFDLSPEHIDEKDREYYRDTAVSIRFGMPRDILEKILSGFCPETIYEAGNIAGSLSKMSTRILSKELQEYVFDDIGAKDLQEMAEIYMPQNFKRKQEMFRHEAMEFWMGAYQQGLLSQADMEGFGFAYEIKKDFKENKKTKEELAEMFGHEYTDIEKIAAEMREKEKQNFLDSVNSGERTIIKDGKGNEYVDTPQGPMSLDISRLGLERGSYKTVKEDDYLKMKRKSMLEDEIRSGRAPVIEDAYGNRYVDTRDGKMGIDELNIKKEDYMPVPEDRYIDFRKAQAQQELDKYQKLSQEAAERQAA